MEELKEMSTKELISLQAGIIGTENGERTPLYRQIAMELDHRFEVEEKRWLRERERKQKRLTQGQEASKTWWFVACLTK